MKNEEIAYLLLRLTRNEYGCEVRIYRCMPRITPSDSGFSKTSPPALLHELLHNRFPVPPKAH